MRLKLCWSKTTTSVIEEETLRERVTRSRPDFGFYDGGSVEGEVAYTGSSLNEVSAPTDENASETVCSQRQPDPFEEDSYRQLRDECEALRKEKMQLARTLSEVEAQAEVVVTQCSQIIKQNNEKLNAALDAVSELNGVVKYLKKESEKQSDTISDLKMERTVLGNRLEAVISELYKRTGSTAFTVQEKLMITPR